MMTSASKIHMAQSPRQKEKGNAQNISYILPVAFSLLP
jgi:hypothetical protein